MNGVFGMVIYWTNRSAKLINLVMDKAHFLSQTSSSWQSEVLGRKTAAFSGAFVSLLLLQFTEGDCSHGLSHALPPLLLLALQGECENLWNHRTKSLETDGLFPVLPWICVSATWSNCKALHWGCSVLSQWSCFFNSSDSVVLDSSCSLSYLSLSHYAFCGGPRGKLHPLIYEI